ncbi:hypothetical protein [Pantoea sp. BAV 3049]|uniref:hypothetical protein n=1 Tax=Pantoea sp. BAV 3049 TaxID=2654188 RepID=UPI00131CCC7E|nr:hypothetical protein [Pantoea sp. BAV 3049]
MSVYKKLSDDTKIAMSRGIKNCSGPDDSWDFETTVGEAKKQGWFATDNGTMEWSAAIIGSNDRFNTYRLYDDSPDPMVRVNYISGVICAIVDKTDENSFIKPGLWSQAELNKNTEWMY